MLFLVRIGIETGREWAIGVVCPIAIIIITTILNV